MRGISGVGLPALFQVSSESFADGNVQAAGSFPNSIVQADVGGVGFVDVVAQTCAYGPSGIRQSESAEGWGYIAGSGEQRQAPSAEEHAAKFCLCLQGLLVSEAAFKVAPHDVFSANHSRFFEGYVAGIEQSEQLEGQHLLAFLL